MSQDNRSTRRRGGLSPSLTLLWGLALALLTGCPKASHVHSGEMLDGARPLMLWEVTKGSSGPDYLFGTCHMGVDIDEALPQEMHELVVAADLFVMEADMSQMMDPSIMGRLMLQDGVTVDQLVGEENWNRLVEEFELGSAAAQMKLLHPFVLSSYLAQKLASEEGGAGTTGSGSMDLVLAGMARRAGVDAGYLETLGQQLDLFLSRDLETWAADLIEMLDPEARAEAREALGAVLGACRTGDAETALKALAGEREEEADWTRAVLYERNVNWIPRLEEFFERGQVFVAAGAGHMVGEDSVVTMLRQRGYKVRQMHGVTLSSEEAAARNEGSSSGEGGESGPPTVKSATFVETIRVSLPALICTESSSFLACFDGAAEACVVEFDAAIPVCAEELELPDEIPGPESRAWGEKLGSCAGEKVYDALEEFRLDTEECRKSGEEVPEAPEKMPEGGN